MEKYIKKDGKDTRRDKKQKGERLRMERMSRLLSEERQLVMGELTCPCESLEVKRNVLFFVCCTFCHFNIQ